MFETALSLIPWALFAPACFALNMSPGPNNMTAFVNGARLPLWAALAASLGRQPAFAILISITAIGLGAALAASGAALWVIKIIGAVYLVYIGWKMITSPTGQARSFDGRAGFWPYMKQDFMFAISNPKAIAIFTAFFPQFLQEGQPVAEQIAVMGVAFLALEVLAAAIYVGCGRLLRGAVDRVGGFGPLQKGVGGFLIFSGAALIVAKD